MDSHQWLSGHEHYKTDSHQWLSGWLSSHEHYKMDSHQWLPGWPSGHEHYESHQWLPGWLSGHEHYETATSGYLVSYLVMNITRWIATVSRQGLMSFGAFAWNSQGLGGYKTDGKIWNFPIPVFLTRLQYTLLFNTLTGSSQAWNKYKVAYQSFCLKMPFS